MFRNQIWFELKKSDITDRDISIPENILFTSSPVLLEDGTFTIRLDAYTVENNEYRDLNEEEEVNLGSFMNDDFLSRVFYSVMCGIIPTHITKGWADFPDISQVFQS